jgi:hypothetical protein
MGLFQERALAFRERQKDALEFCLSVGYERVLEPSDPFADFWGTVVPMALGNVHSHPIGVSPTCLDTGPDLVGLPPFWARVMFTWDHRTNQTISTAKPLQICR